MEITHYGISAIKISDSHQSIYIDAFGDGVPSFELAAMSPLILVTHDDSDHFSAERTGAAARETGATIMGPPSISYPLLVEEKIPPEQLKIVYPVHFTQPVVEEIAGMRVTVYQTRHFIDWEPIHVSYMIEWGGKRLYHTGDSSMLAEELQKLDVLMYADGAFWLEWKEKDFGKALESVLREYEPKYLLPLHLLGCEWTIPVEALKEEVKKRGLERIKIVEKRENVLVL